MGVSVRVGIVAVSVGVCEVVLVGVGAGVGVVTGLIMDEIVAPMDCANRLQPISLR